MKGEVTALPAHVSPTLAADRARALLITPVVSRETAARLDRFVALLLAWQRTTNLIAASTVPCLWTRHIADSLQLVDLAPDARVWVDIGSGGGFPGAVIACALRPESGAVVHLVESNAKKAAFLREAQRELELPAKVHAERFETFTPKFAGPADVVCARAVYPLKPLLDLCFPLLSKTGATGLFPKGRSAQVELAQASKFWKMRAKVVASRTDPAGRIIVIQGLERSATAP
jgi:16S rRNA (guanine527-N7)-methyltransferase